VRVEPVDAKTAPDSILERFAEIEHATWDDERPGEPPRTRDEIVALIRHQPSSHLSLHWLADGGAAHLAVHGPQAAFVELRVVPDRRRTGIGTALLEAVVEGARAAGARALHGHHASAAGAAFAARVGSVDGQRVVRSVLDLRGSTLPPPRVPEGWRLAAWLGRVPDEHLEAYVVARAAMDDAPAPDELAFPSATAATVRASEESLARRRREMRLTVAINAAGRVGAFTELRLSHGSTAAFTDDTGTVAECRGLGLARAVKTESLRLLRADHPEVELVTTSNAEENAVMRHLNESLGFRPVSIDTMSTLGI